MYILYKLITGQCALVQHKYIPATQRKSVEGGMYDVNMLTDNNEDPVPEEMKGERAREVKGKLKEFSVFVKNLPINLDKFGLKGIFQKVGRVWDSYIPRRNGWSS